MIIWRIEAKDDFDGSSEPKRYLHSIEFCGGRGVICITEEPGEAFYLREDRVIDADRLAKSIAYLAGLMSDHTFSPIRLVVEEVHDEAESVDN